jgi:hypothetical protein
MKQIQRQHETKLRRESLLCPDALKSILPPADHESAATA